MSDLERAQEWLGCERYQDEPLVSNCWKHVPGQPKIADLTWPCSEATRLAALLAETRADQDARWRAQWEGKWTTPTSRDDYECCASGSCEVCRGQEHA